MGKKGIIYNVKGFGILEVIIASALLGIVSLGVVSVVDLTTKAGKTADQNSQSIGLMNSANMVFDDAATCQASIGGMTFTTESTSATPTDSNAPYPVSEPSEVLTSISLSTAGGGTVPLIQVGASYSGLRVTSIRLFKKPALVGAPPGPNLERRPVQIEFQFQRDAGTSVGIPTFTRRIATVVIMGTAAHPTTPNQVTACLGGTSLTAAEAEEASCEENFRGTYNAGAVAPMPKCTLNKFMVSNAASSVADWSAAGNWTAGEGLWIRQGIKTSNVVADEITATGGALSTISMLGFLDLQGGSNIGANLNVEGTIRTETGLTVANGNLVLDTGNINVTAGNVTAVQITATSDRRLKENIQTVDNALDKVLRLRGVYFDWKDKSHSKNHQVGVIAQEVEKIIPEVVYTSPEGTKSVAYANLVGVLIEAIKEQQKQIEELKAKTGLKKNNE